METKTEELRTGYLPANGGGSWCIFEPNERGTAKRIIDFGFATAKEADEALQKLKS